MVWVQEANAWGRGNQRWRPGNQCFGHRRPEAGGQQTNGWGRGYQWLVREHKLLGATRKMSDVGAIKGGGTGAKVLGSRTSIGGVHKSSMGVWGARNQCRGHSCSAGADRPTGDSGEAASERYICRDLARGGRGCAGRGGMDRLPEIECEGGGERARERERESERTIGEKRGMGNGEMASEWVTRTDRGGGSIRALD